MKRNSKFSLALHTLVHLSKQPGDQCTSQSIAQHNRTGDAFVRRVLGALRKAGLVTSIKGHGGGWSLARHPNDISLADVYAALGERFFQRPHVGEENPSGCAIEASLNGLIDAALTEAEALLLERLRERSLTDVA